MLNLSINKKTKYNKTFINFMFSYLCILLIPFLVGSLAYIEALKIVEKDSRESTLTTLEQSKDVLDMRLLETYKLSMQISMNKKVAGFVSQHKPFDGTAFYSIYEVINDIKPYWVINDFIKTFYIFFANSNRVISPNASYEYDNFYGSYLEYKGLNKDQWIKRIIEQYHDGSYYPSNEIVFEGKTFKAVTYLKTFPTGNVSKYDGMIAILFDENQLKNLLKSSYEEGGWVYIADREGKIIVSISQKSDIVPLDIGTGKVNGYEKREINNRSMTITYLTSEYSGWRYVAAIPSVYVMNKVNYIKKLVADLMILSLILGFIYAYLLSYKNTKPIKEIIKLLKDFTGNNPEKLRNDFLVMKSTITSLVNSKQELQIELQEQIPLIKSAFFDKLLKGEFDKDQDILTIIKHIGVFIDGKSYSVIILKLTPFDDLVSSDTLSELDALRAIAINTINREVNTNINVCNHSGSNLTLLAGFPSEAREEIVSTIEKMIENVSDYLHEKYRMKVQFAIGSSYSRLTELYRSYDEARHALDNAIYDMDSKSFWYDRISEIKQSFYYPIDIEQRLVNLVRAGEGDEAVEIVGNMFRENFKNRKLPQSVIRQFLYEIKGTYMKIADSINFPYNENANRLEASLMKNEPVEFIRHISTSFLELSQFGAEKKRSRNSSLISGVIEYVNKNINRFDLSLYEIASQFSMTEFYLSHFFKEHTGENLFTYIEKQLA